MLKPSDFNNAIPQFTNGDYASNPINPQYIAEPSAEDYNKGTEPLQTLPAQWWNWFINKFTNRFNKVNIYVKNIFNELAKLLTLVSVTPDGTEGTPTDGQLKDMFENKYPEYLKDTFVTKTTTVNGQPLSSNVNITSVDRASATSDGTPFGSASTKNVGTTTGTVPTIGSNLGTTNGQFLATDASGNLKPSGYSADSFRPSTWTPSRVANADNADALNGYGSSDASTGDTIARRTSGGYLNAIIFHDDCSAENINSYSGATLMFRSSDGYLRNTAPSNVSVGYATSAGSATSASSASYATSAGSATSAGYADSAGSVGGLGASYTQPTSYASGTLTTKAFYWPAGTTENQIWNDVVGFCNYWIDNQYPVEWGYKNENDRIQAIYRIWMNGSHTAIQFNDTGGGNVQQCSAGSYSGIPYPIVVKLTRLDT